MNQPGKTPPPVNKLAIFVEGYTEVVFVERLIEEIAGEGSVLIEHRKIRGGSNVIRSFATVRLVNANIGQEYYVLIVDCGGDALVKTRIMEEHENLTKGGYYKIIGMRDVRPQFARDDIPRLRQELPKYIRTKLIPVDFILAIMETEAWFLAESTHFAKIDPAITVNAISSTLGFDPDADDMATRDAPATDLNNCYAIGGKQYTKPKAYRSVQAIDYAVIYLETIHKFADLRKLIGNIESFLSNPRSPMVEI